MKAGTLIEIAKRLYSSMPGTKLPAIDPDTGNRYWGDVDGTPEWEFCEQIAREILNVKQD